MAHQKTRPSPADLLASISHIGNPAFVLMVGPGPVFRFQGVNPAHTKATGISNDIISGKRPEDVLPPRIAETVLSNYRACYTGGETISYQECLDLPAGRCWWETHLNPIKDENGVFAIVGSSIDITNTREETSRLAVECHHLKDRSTKLQRDLLETAEATRGPLNNIVNFARMLSSGTPSPTECRTVATLVMDTAVRSICDIEPNMPKIQVDTSKTPHGKVDFGHICRDFAALADPQGVLDIEYPKISITCDEALLTILLHALVDDATTYAARKIQIAVQDSPKSKDELRISVAFDALPTASLEFERLKAVGAFCGINVGVSNFSGTYRVHVDIVGAFEQDLSIAQIAQSNPTSPLISRLLSAAHSRVVQPG